MKIVADEHIPYVQDYFGDAGELILKPGRTIHRDDLIDADMLLVRSVTPINQPLLHDTRVRFVGSVTTGADHLDTHWLKEAGIDCAVAHGFNAPPVADYVVSAIAALQRKNILSMHHARAAVIGVGNIGRLVHDRLTLLGYNVVLCDPLRAKSESDFNHCSLDDIADVDLICLHVPLIYSGEHPTHQFINQSFLQRQKPGCVLLNASRGTVIHSADLLQYGTHLFWCFDVWEHEPNIDLAILARAMIGTPHIAGYSVQSKMRGIEMIYQSACERKWITPQKTPSLVMPHQQLTFAGREHHWQDIVMGIFNPIIMTAMLRAAPDSFDALRHQFNYRHEFAYTKIQADDLLPEDKRILQGLGVMICE